MCIDPVIVKHTECSRLSARIPNRVVLIMQCVHCVCITTGWTMPVCASRMSATQHLPVNFVFHDGNSASKNALPCLQVNLTSAGLPPIVLSQLSWTATTFSLLQLALRQKTSRSVEKNILLQLRMIPGPSQGHTKEARRTNFGFNWWWIVQANFYGSISSVQAHQEQAQSLSKWQGEAS